MFSTASPPRLPPPIMLPPVVTTTSFPSNQPMSWKSRGLWIFCTTPPARKAWAGMVCTVASATRSEAQAITAPWGDNMQVPGMFDPKDVITPDQETAVNSGVVASQGLPVPEQAIPAAVGLPSIASVSNGQSGEPNVRSTGSNTRNCDAQNTAGEGEPNQLEQGPVPGRKPEK